ncbi:MAG TPA: DinB family protein [Roseivirga sp.]
MKTKLFTLIIALAFGGSLWAQTPLTKEEKDFALKYMKESTDYMTSTLKGLSEEQLKFKPDAKSWSVEDCLRHLMIAEQGIWMGFVEANLSATPNPSSREGLPWSDEQVIGAITSRDQKATTSAEAEPQNVEGDYKEVLKNFKKLRAEHAKWLKSTDEDLRNRVAQSPVGKIDLYQAVLLISGHVRRHTDQMKEVMANEGFPKQ